MCSADLALEAHDAMDPDDLGPLDGGWSGMHGETYSSSSLERIVICGEMLMDGVVCKDYRQVISYLEGELSRERWEYGG